LTTGATLPAKVDGWITKFTTLMKQTQRNIRDGFRQMDQKRVTETLALVQKTKACLAAI
jgi:hypothetical protein